MAFSVLIAIVIFLHTFSWRRPYYADGRDTFFFVSGKSRGMKKNEMREERSREKRSKDESAALENYIDRRALI